MYKLQLIGKLLDNIEITAKIVEYYSYKLVKKIQNSGTCIVNSEEYIPLINDLLSALSKFSSTYDPAFYTKEAKKNYIKQLLYQANVGVQTKNKKFKDIVINLNKVVIM